jgi:hypothetical protein
MLSGSFPIFSLSNHTTFSQTQTGATVPLNYQDLKMDQTEIRNPGFQSGVVINPLNAYLFVWRWLDTSTV